MTNSPISQDGSSLADLLPDCDPDVDHSGLNNIDPDINLILLSQAKYYNTHDFNHLLSQTTSGGLSFLSHNIQGAHNNLQSLLHYLSSVNHHFQFSIIALSETWFDSFNCSAYDPPGYLGTHMTRTTRTHGGVSIYVNSSLTFRRRDDLSYMTDFLESLFIVVTDPRCIDQTHTTVGIIYRPPNTDLDRFLDSLETITRTLSAEKNTTYIMGDFNLDLLKKHTDNRIQQFLDIMHSHSFIEHIDQPTRITLTSKTLIDNIFSNALTSHTTSGCFYTDISDHFPTFILNHSRASADTPTISVTQRSFTESNRSSFTESLINCDWSPVLQSDDAITGFSTFTQIFQSAYDAAFPIETKSYNPRKIKEWLTPSLKKCIKQKNKLYKIFHRCPTVLNEIKYKSYRRVLHNILRKTEKEHYHTLFSREPNDTKASWKILKSLINKNKATNSVTSIKINDQVTYDKSEIATVLNQHFTSVGPKLAAKIPPEPTNPMDFMQVNSPVSFFFSPCTFNEVRNVILMLKNSSSGHDGVRPDILRDNVDLIVSPLLHLINLSFSQGRLHNSLKIAHVTPIYKAGDPSDPNNYRPISVLSAFSKIFERLAVNKFVEFLDLRRFISSNQYGFRKGYSCELPLLLATDLISEALDQGDCVLGIFLDLKKAFDTVNYQILLSKLERYGFRGPALQWLNDYLSHRLQCVKVDNAISPSLPVTCGVPQGSIMGPLLFLLFINDLCEIQSSFYPFVFADDTTLFLRGRNIEEMSTTATNNLRNICSWLRSNKLSLNIEKTNYLLFTLNPNLRRLPIHINIDHAPISQKQHTKFLGLVIDNKLSWSAHIDYISAKISKNIGVIKKVSRILPQKTLLLLYNALILPYLSYMHIIWSGAARTHTNRLLLLQKKVIRIIHNAPPLSHTQQLFRNTQILEFHDLFPYFASIFLFKHLHSRFPLTFINKFQLPFRSHLSAPTRLLTSPLLEIQRFRTQLRANSAKIRISYHYNNFYLPLSLNLSPSLFVLCKSLKSILS